MGAARWDYGQGFQSGNGIKLQCVNGKDAGIVQEIRKNVDSFCFVVTDPDSKKICFVSWLTNPTSQIRKSGFASPILKDSNCGFVSWPELPKIQPVFTNPTNPDESLVL